MSIIDDEIAKGDLKLLIINNDSLKIQKRLLLEDKIESESFYIDNIFFDTARYRLSPNQIAFGLRISKQRSSRVNPFSETRLWLFATDNNTLRPVLSDALLSNSGGQWDGNCNGKFREKQRVLEMSDTTHNGAADIIMTGKKLISRAAETTDGGREEQTLVEEKSTATLIYNLDL